MPTNDIRNLMAQALLRGFVPNPALWRAMVHQSGNDPFPDRPQLPLYNPYLGPEIPSSNPMAYLPYAQKAMGMLPRSVSQYNFLPDDWSMGGQGGGGGGGFFGGGGTTIDSAINDASGFFNLGTSIANRDPRGIAGSALNLASRFGGSSSLPYVGSLAPYLGILGGAAGLANVAQNPTPANITGAAPGALNMGQNIANLASSYGVGAGAGAAGAGLGAGTYGVLASQAAPSLLGGLGLDLGAGGAGTFGVLASDVAPSLVSGIGGTAGTAGAGVGAGAGSAAAGAGLGAVASGIAWPLLFMALTMEGGLGDMLQGMRHGHKQQSETEGIISDFNRSWPDLMKAPGAARIVEQQLGGGDTLTRNQELDDALRAANASFMALPDVAHFVGTGGGKQGAPFGYPGSDTSGYQSLSPGLASDAYIALLRGSQGLARSGQQLPEGISLQSPSESLWGLSSFSGHPTPDSPMRMQGTAPGFQPYLQGLTDPNEPLVGHDIVRRYMPSITEGSSEMIPDTTTQYDPNWLPDVREQLGAVTPTNQFDKLIEILRSTNPNFGQSTLGREISQIGSTLFPGTPGATSQPSANSTILGQHGVGAGGTPLMTPSAGQQMSNKANMDTEGPSAISSTLAPPSGSSSLDEALQASQAFLGSVR